MTTPDNDRVGSRDLPFPLKNPEASENAEVDASAILNLVPDMFPLDSDERITIQFDLSLNEFVALASALDVGRDPAYGIESYKIWWIWIRSFVGLPNINDCADVADCVETELSTNIELQNAITINNINTGFGNTNHVNADITTVADRNLPFTLSEPVIPLPVCNLNQLWAGIRHGIVARLDDNCRDALEELVAVSDVPERVQVFLDIIPVMGDIVEALLFQIAEVAPDLLDLYNAHSSELELDAIACDLFALVCSECRYPTFEEIFTYYLSFGMSGMPTLYDAVLQVVAEYMLLSVDQLAKIAYFTLQVWQLYILNLQAAFNGQSGTASIAHMARLGEDFANDNWKDLCSSCDELYMIQTYDYRNAQGNSYKTTGYSSQGGTYVAGKGWRVDKINATGGRLTVAQPIDPSWKIRSVAYQTSVPRVDIVSFAGSFRPISGSESGATGLNWNIDSSSNSHARCRNSLVGISGFMEFALSLTKDPIAEIYLEKVVIIFDRDFSPDTGRPDASQDACAQI